MTIHLGDIAPNFIQDSNEGPIDFYEFLGDSWGILFSHPADYTPVCTTELGYTAKLKDEFSKRNVKSSGVAANLRALFCSSIGRCTAASTRDK